MSNSTLLNNLRVASPCPTTWESMVGDNTVRYCHLCQLNVNNFSEMTTAEVEQLVKARNGGRICGRLYQRADGTVLTRDCPVGLSALRKRLARRAGAVLSFVLSLTTPAFSHSVRITKDDEQTGSQHKVERSSSQANQRTALEVTVVDLAGAVIPGAELLVKDEATGQIIKTKTDSQGVLQALPLTGGLYELTVNATGFATFKILHLEVQINETVQVRIELQSRVEVLTGVVGFDYAQDELKTDTLVLPVDAFQKPRRKSLRHDR